MLILNDTGFESGSGWTYSALNAERSNVRARTGSWSCRMRAATALPYGGTVYSDLVDVQPYHRVNWSVYVNMEEVLEPDTEDEASRLRIQVRDAAGQAVTVRTITIADKTTSWQRFSGTYFPPAGVEQLALQFVTDITGGGGGEPWEDFYHMDDVWLEAPYSLNMVLRNALEADLNTIDTSNGYRFNLESAGTISVEGMLDPRKVATPAVCIIPGTGGNSQLESMGNADGRADQRFHLQLVVRDAQPHLAGMAFLDDVVNAVERPDSNLLDVEETYYTVEYAGVESWTQVYFDQEIGLDYGQLNAVVRVAYHYRRGQR